MDNDNMILFADEELTPGYRLMKVPGNYAVKLYEYRERVTKDSPIEGLTPGELEELKDTPTRVDPELIEAAKEIADKWEANRVTYRMVDGKIVVVRLN